MPTKDAKKKADGDVESKINEIIADGSGLGGANPKMEVDYSETVATKMPVAEQLAKEGNSFIISR